MSVHFTDRLHSHCLCPWTLTLVGKEGVRHWPQVGWVFIPWTPVCESQGLEHASLMYDQYMLCYYQFNNLRSKDRKTSMIAQLYVKLCCLFLVKLWNAGCRNDCQTAPCTSRARSPEACAQAWLKVWTALLKRTCSVQVLLSFQQPTLQRVMERQWPFSCTCSCLVCFKWNYEMYPQLRFIHTHQWLKIQYTCFELEAVNIDWLKRISVCLAVGCWNEIALLPSLRADF